MVFSETQQIKQVKQIFNTVTSKYDLMNHILSAGQDILWRKFAARKLPHDAKHILDIATGTGDMLFEICKLHPNASVTGLDFVPKMMELAVSKASSREITLNLLAGDAMDLPFPDDTFDATTIAFGLRNIPDRKGAIEEMARVVKQGGKVTTLEMTFPKNLKMRKFFTWYLNNIIPPMGKLIAGNQDAYRYLKDSIQGFLHPDQLSKLFYEAGLIEVKSHPLSLGITYFHEGTVK